MVSHECKSQKKGKHIVRDPPHSENESVQAYDAKEHEIWWNTIKPRDASEGRLPIVVPNAGITNTLS